MVTWIVNRLQSLQCGIVGVPVSVLSLDSIPPGQEGDNVAQKVITVRPVLIKHREDLH
jgi:hypothetical protein